MRLELNFTPEGFRSRSCEGRVEYTLRPRIPGMTFVRLNAADMQILDARSGGNDKLPYSYDDKILTIQLPRAAQPDESISVGVRYRLQDPPKGMYFVLPSASFPDKPTMVYTMSEPLEARYWVPTHDWPNERWTSDITVRVPAPYSAVANGVLLEKKADADGKFQSFHWRNEIPTDPHLMGLVVGELVELKQTWRNKPVTVYTQPGSEEAARYTCRRVPEMIEFYTKLTGVEFPYPGYSHITVVDHHHGGMEHAGFSFVNPNFLAASEDGAWPLEMTESIYLSHMLAHQWFGGIVNYRNVSEAWLNEGFAILLDSEWTSHTDSAHRFSCKMWETAARVAAADSSERGKPMVNRNLRDPDDIYRDDGGKVYYKGGWVLHMLRHQLSEKIFWDGVRNYLQGHRWGAVETGDLRRSLEEASGQDLEQFFEQWVYRHGVPRLDVQYHWNLASKQATVAIRQTQKIDTATPAFALPVDLYFKADGQEKIITVNLSGVRHEFTLPFAAEPSIFCVDPQGVLLKTLAMAVPRTMLRAQAEHGPTAVSRLTAVTQLATHSGSEVCDTLERVLKDESEFWMVRRAAALGLGKMQTEESLAALLRAEKQGIQQPRVLAGLVEALGGYVASPEAHATVLKHAQLEPKLYVQMAAVAALGRMRAAPALVEKSLLTLGLIAKGPTRRAVRGAAIQALAALGDAIGHELLTVLAQPERHDELRQQMLPALGRLGRQEKLRNATLMMLMQWLDDPDRSIQSASANALGQLGDPRSIADLERIRTSARGEAIREAAQRAIAAIQQRPAAREGSPTVLERLTAIEKHNQELDRKLKRLDDALRKLEKPPTGQPGKPVGK
jgi:aminopeptidase N